MKSLLFIIVYTILSCVGCTRENDNAGSSSGQDDNTGKTELVGTKVVVTPAEYESAFRNPMTGLRDVFAVGLDPIPDNYPLPFGSVYKEYIPWDRIENVKTDGVDKVIDYSNHRFNALGNWGGIEKKNIKVIPRVYIHWLGTPPVSDPDRLDGVRFPSDIPYTYESGTPYPMKGGYFDPTFQDRVKALVDKLGQAWDNDPRVAYVEMGIVGQWGEHHSPMIGTDWKPHDAAEHQENVTWIRGIEKTLGDAFAKAFKNKKVMVRYAYDFTDYRFGYYWDSWAVGEEDIRGYDWIKKTGDRWKTQPIGGELCWNWGDLSRFNSLTEMLSDTPTREKIINQIRELHANHLGYFCYARPEIDFAQPDLMKYAKELQLALGYRFVINEFTYDCRLEGGKTFEVSFKVQNEGSSPFYYNWPVEIMLLDKNSKEKVWGKVLDGLDITQWLPGDEWDRTSQKYMEQAGEYEVRQTLELDADIPDGEYIIAVAVLDPAGMLPSLRFAVKNYFTGGVHPMGYVGVGKDLKEYSMKSSEFDNIFNDTTLHYEVE